MGALEFVLGLNRQKQQSEFKQAELIQQGFENAATRQQRTIQNRQQQELIGLKREKNEIDSLLSKAKLTSALTEQSFLQGAIEQAEESETARTDRAGRKQTALEIAQKRLPPGVTQKIGAFTITGTKVESAQRKALSEIQATEGTVERVKKLSETVPDLGALKTKGLGRVLSILPRGVEGRAREAVSKFITAGAGGGLSGLTTEQDENLRTYIANLPTTGGELYKALSGDTGRLSDFDIERGMNLAWRPDFGETPAIRDKKNAVLKEAVDQRKIFIKQGRFTIGQNGEILTPEVLNNALAKLSGIVPPAPEGVSEEDIQFTMKEMGLTRAQVIERLP